MTTDELADELDRITMQDAPRKTIKDMIGVPPQQTPTVTVPPKSRTGGNLSHEERYAIYREVKVEISQAQNALTGLKSVETDLGSAIKRLQSVEALRVTMPFGDMDFGAIVTRVKDVAEDVNNAVNTLQRMADGQ